MKKLIAFAVFLSALPAYARRLVPVQMECRDVSNDPHYPTASKRNETKIGKDLVCRPSGQSPTTTQPSSQLNAQPGAPFLVPNIDVPHPAPVKTAAINPVHPRDEESDWASPL